VLVGAAEIVDWNNRMQGNGIISKGIEIDWAALMRFKSTFTEPVPKSTEQWFVKAGIIPFHGRARFVDKTAVMVGDDTLEARHLLIATGAWPVRLGIPGEQYLTRSDEFLELETLPKRVIFVGGGYISFEFAHIAARAGAQVKILHRGARPLVGFDPDLVKNCRFFGLVRIGKLESLYLEFNNIRLQVGLYDSTIISCDFGDNVVVNNV